MSALLEMRSTTIEVNGKTEVLASTGNYLTGYFPLLPINRLLIITWQGGRG